MKESIKEVIEKCCSDIEMDLIDDIESGKEYSAVICSLSCVQKDKAERLFKDMVDKVDACPYPDVISLAHLLIAAKDLGYNERDMREYIDILEQERHRGLWGNDVWLNSLVLKAMGRYGISYPWMADYLLKNRLPNGSWFDKVWVTSYALPALFYSHAEPKELSASAEYLKEVLDGDHWKVEERGKIDEIGVTSLALEGLLLIGEGYEEEPLTSVIDWVEDKIYQTNEITDIATLMKPLTLIVRGRAKKETVYKRSQPVIWKETKVEIAEQVVGNKVEGDYVEKGGTQLKDSVAIRSNIGGGEGGAEMDSSVALRSDVGGDGCASMKDSIAIRSKIGRDKKRVCYDVFTGEKVSGPPCYCPKCGTKVIEDHQYCPGCGFEMGKVREIFGSSVR